MLNPFDTLFAESFDTFKVFDDLKLSEVANPPAGSPKTIWQIINHLTALQAHQLSQLRCVNDDLPIDEGATWIPEKNADTQHRLDSVIMLFNEQLLQVKAELRNFNITDHDIMKKLKLVQDLSVHLSFHVGEVVLMRRLTGHYPLPQHMKQFLA